MKQLSLHNLKSQLSVRLTYSWTYYLYLNKYKIVCYFTYDGAESKLISALKLQLIKNENKLVIINKKQINYFFRKSPFNTLKFLNTGRYLMLLFNTWQELYACLKTELGINLTNRYQFITISDDGQFLNLFWYKNPLNWILNNYINANVVRLQLVSILYSSFFCFYYCLQHFITVVLILITKINSTSILQPHE